MSQDKYEFCVTLTGHSGTITALQFSPDCKFLASGSNHGVLLIFSTFSWRPVKRLIDASSITTLVWHDTERYLLLCGCESGDLHFLKFTKSLDIAIDSTSYLGAPIRSVSFSPATSTLAIGYGESVSVRGITLGPYGLGEGQKLLPKPPLQPSGERPSQLVPISLHFLGKGNQLIVTYLNYGIICWDLPAMSAIRKIITSASLIGRSVLSRDRDTMATSNLVDGVDWYSLSSSKLISSSKIPISKSSSTSSLAYSDGDNAIVIGGLSGQTYIVDRQTFNVRQELDHDDKRDIESVAFSPASGRRKLIATGAAGSEGAAPISIWVSTPGGNYATLLVAVRNAGLKGFSWSEAFVYFALFFLFCAWVSHFLTAG